MVRVRENAKRIKTNQNEGETNSPPPPPPPPPPLEETEGETSSQRAQQEGETNPPPPPQKDTGGEEASSSLREILRTERSNYASSREETTGNKITVTINLDPLNCRTCSDRLSPPIHECINGHPACLSCWAKLQYNCSTCGEPIGPQNIALGKILESIHLPCPNANYGCHKSVSYSQMQVHNETCEFGPSQEETTGRNGIRVTIDPDSLKCSICTNLLCPPIYQCINDHIACFSCYKKEQYKCPTCYKRIGGSNNALYHLLKSIQLPCPHANFGCRQSLDYFKMQLHSKTCEFGPSLCPIPGCAHKAISGEWQAHFLKDHGEPTIRYRYGQSHTIKFNEEDHYYTFLGPGKDVCLLVKKLIPNFGNVISLFYVDLADLGQNHFSYELEQWATGERYNFPAIVSINEWKRGKVHGSYSLVVSSQFPLSIYKFSVLINKERNLSS